MGKASKKLMDAKMQAAANKEDGGRRDDEARKDKLSRAQAKALKAIQNEAKQVNSLLTTGGKGGLDPRLVVQVMRRDEYACKSCGERGDDNNGGIGVHHKGGIVDSEWLSKKGHQNDVNNLVTICERCHDREHNEARRKHEDASQVTPQGDKGTMRDRGLPKPLVDKHRKKAKP